MKALSAVAIISAILLVACQPRYREEPKTEAEVSAEIEKRWPKAITTSTGLKYVIKKEGEGDATPSPGTMVKAHYTGWLLDGTKFDSSVDRGEPIEFPVGTSQVIAGWDEALLAMKKGEKRTLIIPPQLGYGGRRKGSIPANSTLVFDVELVDF